MPRVFSTNLNVGTCPDVAPLANDVISWAWRDPATSEADQRRSLEAATAWTLRRFPDASEAAAAYHAGKRLLPRDGPGDLWRACRWVIGEIAAADRVLAGPPLGGVDRLLWVVAVAAACLMGKGIYLYSETWMLPRGLRHMLRRATHQGLARRADRVLVPADVHRSYYERMGLPADRVWRIPSIYSPTPPVKPVLGRAPRTRDLTTFLYVGRLVPYKGLHRLIAAAAELVRRGCAFRLVIVTGQAAQYMGSDPEYGRDCLEAVSARLPADRVRIVDHQPDLDPVYAAADVLVVPGIVIPTDRVPSEAWGRIVEEALLNDVAVIATNAVPAGVQLVEDGVNGYIVDWRDTDALTSAMHATIASRPQ